MQIPKAIQWYNLILEEEKGRFGKWLNSPWYNSNKRLTQLNKVLKTYPALYEGKRFSKEKLFKRTYPDRPYDDGIFRNLLTEFYKQIRAFLIHERFGKDLAGQQKYLLEALATRGKGDRLVSEAQAELERQNAKGVWEWQDYLSVLLLQELVYYQAGTQHRQVENSESLRLAEVMLDQFYLLGRLRFACEQKERAKRLKQTYVINFDGALLGELINKYDIPAAKLYWQHLNKIEGDLEDFEIRYKAYLDAQNQLEKKDQRILFHYLINEVSRLFGRGSIQVLEIAFQLYKLGTKTGLLLHDEQLTEHTYMNMVTVSNSLKYFDETVAFMEQYTGYLPISLQDDAYRFAQAHLYYHQGAFDQCSQAIKDHHFASISFINRSRLLLLQTYYEFLLADETFYFTFWDQAISFETYLRRDERLHEKRVMAYLRFSQYCRRLGRCFYDLAEKVQLDQLEKDIKAEEFLNARLWLFEKLDQLRNELR